VPGGSMMCESAEMIGLRMMEFVAPMIAPLIFLVAPTRSRVA